MNRCPKARVSFLRFVIALFLAAPAAHVVSAAQSTPTAATDLPTIKLDAPITLTHSAKIAPGNYHLSVPDGSAVIELAADNITLDLNGVTIESGAKNPWERVGIGVHSNAHSHIEIRGGAIHGFRFNIFLEGEAGDGANIKVMYMDLSRSRAQKLISTETHYDEADWINIFDLDAWESYGAGLYLKNLDDVWVENVTAHDAQNGILLARTSRATIYKSDLSKNSGWGIALYNSSQNNLLQNHADWNVRCESKSYSHGCDSASILLIEGSNHNRIVDNSFTHSGDGYFLSKASTGNSSDSNYVAYNDGSDSPHNSFESTFTSGDEFYHNIARHSAYGFWLGFSRNTTVTDNDIEDSLHDGVAIEHGESNTIIHNRISTSKEIGIWLFQRGSAPDPSRDYTIAGNTFTSNKLAILIEKTDDVSIHDNQLSTNMADIKVDPSATHIRVAANRFEHPILSPHPL